MAPARASPSGSEPLLQIDVGALEESRMRIPRDINAEFKALAEKVKGLKAQRLIRLGQPVLLTGTDALDLDTPAGALLAAVKESDPEAKEAWRA